MCPCSQWLRPLHQTAAHQICCFRLVAMAGVRAHCLHGTQCALSPDTSLCWTSALHADLQVLRNVFGMAGQSLQNSQASLRTGPSSIPQSSPRCGICSKSAELRMVQQQLDGNIVDDEEVIRQSVHYLVQVALFAWSVLCTSVARRLALMG